MSDESPTPKQLSLVFVLDPSQGLLLGLKQRGFGTGKWNGFGGKLQSGESMRECASRELHEECGLLIDAVKLRPRGTLMFNMLSDGMMSANRNSASCLDVHIFSCTFEDTIGEVSASEEMHPQWWPLDAVPFDMMWADEQFWLPEVLAGRDVRCDFTFADASTITEHKVTVLSAGTIEAEDQRRSRLRVDHLVYGTSGRLEDACIEFYELTGVRPAVGGVHKGLGTHNALVSLGEGAYFEIIAIDPQQPSPERVWMAMTSVAAAGTNRMVTWATDRAGTMEQTVESAATKAYDAGAIQAFERQTPQGTYIRWRLAYRHYKEQDLPSGGIVPFLIEWGDGVVTPAATAPQGCSLLSLRAVAMDEESAAKQLSALGIEPADLLVTAEVGAPTGPRLIATLRTPKGVVEFG